MWEHLSDGGKTSSIADPVFQYPVTSIQYQYPVLVFPYPVSSFSGIRYQSSLAVPCAAAAAPIMHYAMCIVHYALGIRHCALFIMHYALCKFVCDINCLSLAVSLMLMFAKLLMVDYCCHWCSTVWSLFEIFGVFCFCFVLHVGVCPWCWC